jgi:uncharacterized protein
MSRLKDKLARRNRGRDDATISNGPSSQDDIAEERSAVIEELRRKLEAAGDRRPQHRPTAAKKRGDELPGEEIVTDAGTVLLRCRRFGRNYHHGLRPAARFLDCGAKLAELAGRPNLETLDPRGALFIDTETTGLAGGTGTLAFLVGVGGFKEDGAFVTDQFFCRGPSEEPTQLAALAERLAEASAIVSFNGLAFDMPLLNTRYVLQRMRNPAALLPHLDLLHVARKVFKRRLERVNLTRLEAAVLGFERVGDIPGSAIPGAYRAYLRGGPLEPMEAVLEHNALDLVGLAALAAVLEEMYTDPETVEHALDHLGLARAALGAGDRDGAEADRKSVV